MVYSVCSAVVPLLFLLSLRRITFFVFLSELVGILFAGLYLIGNT